MDGPRDYHTNEIRKRQILYDITYLGNLKYNTNELIYKSETDSQTQRTDLGLLREGVEEGWIGSLGLADVNYYIQDVQHRELYSVSCNKPQWKRIWKKYIYMYD